MSKPRTEEETNALLKKKEKDWAQMLMNTNRLKKEGKEKTNRAMNLAVQMNKNITSRQKLSTYRRLRENSVPNSAMNAYIQYKRLGENILMNTNYKRPPPNRGHPLTRHFNGKNLGKSKSKSRNQTRKSPNVTNV